MTAGDSGALRLRPPRRSIDRRARAWWWTQWALTLTPVLLALGVLAWLIAPARPWLLLSLAVVAIAGVPSAVLLPIWWYHVHRWEVTGDAVYTRTGHFWQEWRVAPMSRIQTVDTRRGPLERLFGLATVTVTTASAKGAVEIPGLDHALAADLVEQLTRTTQATPGDAT
ncbi:PH domain-containing protein [Saccharomonospora xinjiangensis]|uniref:PH domain-containing protein n=1 Tax=Saccharomonospora xinjiangensis TaxID=75294 RepID=UPI00106F5D2C|nr:PH domain-containing protein [Saccharomonospora xinjiangensis]QBQ60014.1 Bacterial membrane flanked domain protein [Saccharomonospora xinjiangensis]